MNISDMPAGREMDLQIAREVFGLTKPPVIDSCWERRGDGAWYENVWRDSWEIRWPPDYSVYIVNAWEVIELFRLGWNGHAAACMQIEMYDLCYVGNDYCVSIQAPDIPRVSMWADTAPLAICRAALTAIERCKDEAGEYPRESCS